MSLWNKNMPYGATDKDCQFINKGCIDMFTKCDKCKHNKHNKTRKTKSYFECDEKTESEKIMKIKEKPVNMEVSEWIKTKDGMVESIVKALNKNDDLFLDILWNLSMFYRTPMWEQTPRYVALECRKDDSNNLIDINKIRNMSNIEIFELLKEIYSSGVAEGGSESYDFEDAIKYCSKNIKKG